MAGLPDWTVVCKSRAEAGFAFPLERFGVGPPVRA